MTNRHRLEDILGRVHTQYSAIKQQRDDFAWLLGEVTRLREAEALLLDDVFVLVDQHTSDEVKLETRRRIIERYAA